MMHWLYSSYETHICLFSRVFGHNFKLISVGYTRYRCPVNPHLFAFLTGKSQLNQVVFISQIVVLFHSFSRLSLFFPVTSFALMNVYLFTVDYSSVCALLVHQLFLRLVFSCFPGGQVAKLFQDSSLGNAVNIVVTRLILLMEDQVNAPPLCMPLCILVLLSVSVLAAQNLSPGSLYALFVCVSNYWLKRLFLHLSRWTVC